MVHALTYMRMCTMGTHKDIRTVENKMGQNCLRCLAMICNIFSNFGILKYEIMLL